MYKFLNYLTEMAYGLDADKQLNVDELKEVIQAQAKRGTNFVSFTSVTDARLKKTNNPYKITYKVSQVNAALGVDYTKAVNRQRDKEGKETDFQAQDRLYGEMEENVLVYNGKYYLRVIPKTATKPLYVTERDGGFVEVTKGQIEPFLPAQYSAQSQGTDSEIAFRNYLLTSIYAITINGIEYLIEENATRLNPIIDVVRDKLRT